MEAVPACDMLETATYATDSSILKVEVSVLPKQTNSVSELYRLSDRHWSANFSATSRRNPPGVVNLSFLD
jgi:hypothetical protein